ncbi:MAG: hypothetical protein O7G30_05980 [Proteobacteria bacterium]|nr:hypothetical protein [Pseudomonadota bacterium]
MGIELFERAAEAGGQILRVERADASEGGGSALAYLLTFDVGRIWVRSDPLAGGVAAELAEGAPEGPTGLVSVDDEEPWWRVLGEPLRRAWETADGDARGFRLQFRSDDDKPRFVLLTPAGGLVRAGLEASHVR